MEEIILDKTNLEGMCLGTHGDQVDLQAYIGMFILTGVYLTNNEATHSVGCRVQKGPIFQSTLSLQQFHVLSRIIRFDNRDTRPASW